MVPDPGAPLGPGRLRSLNWPQPVHVETGAGGRLEAVSINRRLAVEQVLESWRIDDEWWRRRPVSRLYWRVLLEDGRVVDVYRDLADGRWFRQSYG